MEKQAPRKNFSTPDSLRDPCQHDGCNRRPAFGYYRCSTHRPQFEKYGFSWDEYPHEKIAEWKKANNPPCEVKNCDSPKTSQKAIFCKNHTGDWRRKHCSVEFYLQLHEVDACAICHATNERLVTDHDHRHPHRRDEMCQECIRGRICASCNTALGHLKDDPARMYALAAYAALHAEKF